MGVPELLKLRKSIQCLLECHILLHSKTEKWIGSVLIFGHEV